MNADLEAIRDTMEDKETRDRAAARDLAEAYIATNPDEFAELSAKSFEEVVEAVDVFRDAGFETERWRCEAYLLHLFPEPQTIGGELTVGNPIPGGGE